MLFSLSVYPRLIPEVRKGRADEDENVLHACVRPVLSYRSEMFASAADAKGEDALHWAKPYLSKTLKETAIQYHGQIPRLLLVVGKPLISD